MLNFYRDYGPPIVATFVIALALGLAALVGVKQTSHDGNKANRNSEYSEATDNGAAPIFEPPVVGLLPPKNRPETTYQSYQTEQYDLVAQRWMAWLTGLLACFTGIGVVLLWLTLRETGKVLNEAKKTTDAAISGAKAAWASENTARDIGRKQSKAYLIVTGASYTPARPANALSTKYIPDPSYVKLQVTNIGNTAALSVEVYHEVQVFDASQHQLLDLRRYVPMTQPSTPQLHSNIAPNQSLPISLVGRVTDPFTVNPSDAHPRWYFLRGEVRYLDVFGEAQRTCFQFWQALFQTESNEIELTHFPVRLPAFEVITPQKADHHKKQN